MFRQLHRVAALHKLLHKPKPLGFITINVRAPAVNGSIPLLLHQPLSFKASRFYCGNHTPPNVNNITLQMINYALNLARSQKTGFSLSFFYLVLVFTIFCLIDFLFLNVENQNVWLLDFIGVYLGFCCFWRFFFDLVMTTLHCSFCS